MSDFTTPDEINDDEWEPVVCLSGRKYAVRRIGPGELAMNGILAIPGVDLLDEIKEKVKAGKPVTENDLAVMRAVENALLCLGVASLKVVDLPREQCPKGTVSVDALKADRDELVFAISRKSGFGQDAQADQETVVNENPREGESFRAEESAPVAPAEAAGERAAH